MSEPKNRGGRPPSPNPRAEHVSVKLTAAEWLEARRVAAIEGVSVSDVLRRAIPRASRVTSMAPAATGITRTA